MAEITLTRLRNTTEEVRNFDELRQYPLAVREFLKNRKGAFDLLYSNRKTDTFLHRFKSVKYPVRDRDFGSPNADICNVFLNLLNDREIQEIIDEYTFNRQWIYHPVRKFEKWHTIASLYYGQGAYFWLILVFNRIVDPFKALEHFNIVRVPDFSFLQDLPYTITFDYSSAKF